MKPPYWQQVIENLMLGNQLLTPSEARNIAATATQWVEENPDADRRDGTRPAAVVSRAKAADNIVKRGDWQAALRIIDDALAAVAAIPPNLWPFLAEALSKTQNEKLTKRMYRVGQDLYTHHTLVGMGYGKAAKR